jgi:hypothetical protein
MSSVLVMLIQENYHKFPHSLVFDSLRFTLVTFENNCHQRAWQLSLMSLVVARYVMKHKIHTSDQIIHMNPKQ